MRETPLRILHVASEVAPFSKTGGLADVASALPKSQAAMGHDVTVVSPYYASLRGLTAASPAFSVSASLNHHDFTFEFFEHRADSNGPRFVFVKCDELYGRASYYAESATGRDYVDNDRRFACLALAALSYLEKLGERPDIVHGHDWQSAPLALFMRSPRFSSFFDNSRFVFTIHNMAFQGDFGSGSTVWVDHAKDHFVPGGPVEFHDRFNFMKMALEFADAINTVSPTYAHELRSADSAGFGLTPVLQTRHKHFWGILNGLDTEVWNPETDTLLAAQYSATTLALRSRNKRELCARVGFHYDHHIPLCAVVSRLTNQKGIDLLTAITGQIISAPAQLLVLGNGDNGYERQFRDFERAYPQRVRLVTDYNDPLAHLIYGGADVFLMPSLFEPCGLSQMMAMRYGLPPVARATGGLVDTVSDADRNPGSGTGFLFTDYTPEAFWHSLQHALALWRKENRWRAIQRNAMSQDFSWRRSARVYLDMYVRAMEQDRVR